MNSSFPSEVQEKLKWYVYRLIDPRNGETFYVGKGKGDRVFAHSKAAIESDDPSDKLKRIFEIKNAGLEVGHVIHRHGMEEDIAFEVEAALIDAFPGLTNIMIGIGANDYGVMHTQQIINRYQAEKAVFQHKCILIIINNSSDEYKPYDAARYAWVINPVKAQRADYVCAVRFGLIVDVFGDITWKEATEQNFPEFSPHPGPVPGRYGFTGKDAPSDVKALYVNKRIPDEYRKPGAANPIKYTYK